MSEPVVPPANDAEPREVLELVHHHPGRLRVRSRALRGDSTAAVRVIESLSALPGVARVTHNPSTGSLLVEYEPGHVEPDAIIARIAETANLLSPFDPRAKKIAARPADAIIVGARELNAVTSELTGLRADLRTLVPAALAGVAAYSFVYGKGPRLPRWDNLLYWSYSIFSALHAREITEQTGAPATPPDGGVEG